MVRKNKFFLVVFFALFLSGCESPIYPQAKPVPTIQFDHLYPYVIQGGRTQVTQSFVTDAETARVAQEFRIEPVNLLGRYAEQRFETVQGPVNLVFDIQKARLTKKTAKTAPLDFMTGFSQDVYNLDVFLALYPVKNDIKQAPYTISYTQSLTISSNVSLADREYRQFEFMENMISDIDQSITEIVTQKINR